MLQTDWAENHVKLKNKALLIKALYKAPEKGRAK
jgi:hypothetical protein